MASFCESCGSQLDQDARFCRSCGRPIAAAGAAGTPPPPVPPPPAPAQPWAAPEQAAPWAAGGAVAATGGGIGMLLKIIGGLVVGLVLLFVAAIAFAFLAASGPNDAVTAYMTALAKSDDAAAYALTSSGVRSAISATQFAAVVGLVPPFRSGTLSITKSEIPSGDTATVTAVLAAADGARRTLDFGLVKEGGAWKVEKLRVSGNSLIAPGPLAIESITLHRDDGTGEAGEIVTAFRPADRRLFFEATLNRAEAGVIKAKVGLIVLTPSGAEGEKSVLPLAVTGPANSLTAKLSLPKGLPTGRYRVDFYLSDQLAKSLGFEVKP